MENEKKQIPTLETFLQGLKVPVFISNPQTPDEAVSDWYKKQEENYYEIYGQDKIEELKVELQKESE